MTYSLHYYCANAIIAIINYIVIYEFISSAINIDVYCSLWRLICAIRFFLVCDPAMRKVEKINKLKCWVRGARKH
jgi:hypothetical protein